MDMVRETFPETLFKARGFVRLACRAANISRATYYAWIKEDKDFEKSCLDAQEMAADYLETRLIDMCIEKDLNAMKYYFARNRILRERGYGENLDGSNNATVKDVTGLDKEMFNKYLDYKIQEAMSEKLKELGVNVYTTTLEVTDDNNNTGNGSEN